MYQQNKVFESFMKIYIPYLNNRVKSIIEFYSCYLAFNHQEVFEISHDDDPPFDFSGRPISTNIYITPESTMSLCNVLESYNGISEPSYQSGHGLFHKTNSDECQDIVDEFLFTFTSKVIEECIKSKMFVNYFDNQFDECYSLEDNIFDFASEFVADFFYCYTDSKGKCLFQVEDRLDELFAQQPLRIVYTKYNVYLYRYKNKLNHCKEYNNKILSKYQKLADEIYIKDIFKTKIQRKTILWEELRKTYTQKQLSILFEFEKLKASTSISSFYKNMFNEEMKDKLLTYPNQYDFLYRDMNDEIMYNINNIPKAAFA